MYFTIDSKVVAGSEKIQGGYIAYTESGLYSSYEPPDTEKDTEADKTYKQAGIGLFHPEFKRASVKVTGLNVGMSYDKYYISLQNNKAVFRTTDNLGPRLVLDGHSADKHIGIGYNYTSISSHENRILLEIGNTTKGKVYSDDEVKINAEKLTFGPWIENIQADGT
jgi:hypothetical protein